MLWVNGFVFWMAVAAPRAEIRRRFFFGYIFAWAVLGNFVAWLTISAGPALAPGWMSIPVRLWEYSDMIRAAIVAPS